MLMMMANYRLVRSRKSSRTKIRAKIVVSYHTWVLHSSREAEPNTGDYSDPVELFRHGAITDLE